jgi:alanyl-tRNA synthetase
MKPQTSDEVRQAFLDFFQELRHQVVPSSPLPVPENPTLLFTNAGMNQFVDVFLGKEERPYTRAATAQKCMRVQGKHNDLENVGPSPRHHTFFEMLGNFSFGDYFKEGAIRYASDFLTMVCQIPVDRLWYTVHEDDDDAYRVWVDDIGVDPERVVRMGDKTNFWMMGDVGPCGPTSEVHYDWGPEHCTCNRLDCGIKLDNDCGRWLEFWNLVFMQYDQLADGRRVALPRPGVDTGMGLERIVAIVQQEPVNYRTDLFSGAMERVQALLGHSNRDRAESETSYRVIADHGRAATFLIADGVTPGNVGEGYVLRMIIRRAARFGRTIGLLAPFLSEIADVYIGQMGGVYPELRMNQELIRHTLHQEEERFARTVDGALHQLASILDGMESGGQDTVPGDVAFDLYATHGLPLEITRDVAQERGLTVDEAGFKVARDAHALVSGAGAFDRYGGAADHLTGLLNDLVSRGKLDKSGVRYDPYLGPELKSEVLALIVDRQVVESASAGQEVEVVTASTPFYLEAGGEVSDTGLIKAVDGSSTVAVHEVRQPMAGLIVHLGTVQQGTLRTGQSVRMLVDDSRRWDIRRNHTATHILHRELRAKLGNHVTQQGSLVAPDRLRFDFSHGQALDADSLADIEAAVNRAILRNMPVQASYMARQRAIQAGAMALFGEKYGETVRTIRIGDAESPYSFELCGGLHVQATGDIGLFRFTTEEAVGAGLRRVEAVTGREAQSLVRERLALLDRLARRLNSPVEELEPRLETLLTEGRALQREISRLRHLEAREQFEALASKVQVVNQVTIMSAQVDVGSMDGLREMADWFRDRFDSGAAAFGTVHDGKPLLVVAITEDLVARGLRAGDLVGELARMVGGGGGGRPTLAQAGGRDASRLPGAMDAFPQLVSEALAE